MKKIHVVLNDSSLVASFSSPGAAEACAKIVEGKQVDVIEITVYDTLVEWYQVENQIASSTAPRVPDEEEKAS